MSDPVLGAFSKVVVDYETSWGVAKGSPTGFHIPVTICALAPSQSLIPNPTLTGDLSERDPAFGPIAATGNLVKVADLVTFPFFTQLLCGNLAGAGAGPNYTHTSKISSNMPLSAVVETSWNLAVPQYSKASGVRIQTMTIPIDSTGFLSTTYALEAKTVTIGTTPYSAGSVAVAAADLLSGTLAPSNNDTVQAGSVVYTFKTTLTGAANEVLIGGTGSAADALYNLASAINAGDDIGVTYGTGTTANADVSASTLTSSSLLCVAKVAGVAGNSLGALHAVGSHLTWSHATTFTGGVDAGSLTDWTTSASSPFDGLQLASADCKIGSSAVGFISKGSISVAAGLGGSDYRDGSGGARGSLVPSVYKVTGSLDLALDSSAVLALIASASTPVSLDFTWTQAAGSTFQIIIPRAFISRTGPALTGPGAIMVTAQFNAAFDTATQTSCEFITSNQTTNAAYT